MTKRRAEDSLLCDIPLKRCSRTRCKIDLQLPGMAISCGGKTANSSPLPTLADNCRKRAYFSEDQELLEVARPRKKSSKDSAVRPVVGSHVQVNDSIVQGNNSGRFQEENKAFPHFALRSPQEASKKRQREETVDSQDAEFQTEKETPAGDDLCSFNSFQYWRVPLPELDMSLLQADGDTGEPSGEPAKDSSVLSEMDAMET